MSSSWTNKVTIYKLDGGELHFDMKPKREVASDIIDTLLSL
ncbi:hypothetical protein [uncultured Muribaculum sp.]|nr:hypothetical protein [uncultured Muribaculum sp.]